MAFPLWTAAQHTLAHVVEEFKDADKQRNQ